MNQNTEDREDKDVVVFWDFETLPASSSTSIISTYETVKNIQLAVATYGPLKSMRLYWDFDISLVPSTTLRIRSELSASGVTLIDCPAEGRKGAAAKKMLVDMILHAWDCPFSLTLVVITGDRDLAYGLAMLRMRSYRVVLISPAGSHPDLTSQASVHLDWSRTILGINGGSNEDGLFLNNSSNPMPSSTPAPARSSISSSGHGTRTIWTETPLRDSPALLHKPSIFSNSYGDAFGDPRFSSPKLSSGLGDGPLFPRPQTANQQPSRSRSGSFRDPLSLRPTTLTNKGKSKASELDDIKPDPPPPPASSRSRLGSSVFEPFGEEEEKLPHSQRSSPAPEVPERALSSESSGSRQSKFSFEDIPKPIETNSPKPLEQQPTKPTDEEPTRLSNGPRSVVFESPQEPNSKLPTLSSPSQVVLSTTSLQSSKASTSQTAAPQLPVSDTSKPSNTFSSPWLPLIETLLRHKGVLSRQIIGQTLLSYYPNALGKKKIGKYLQAARSANIILDDRIDIHLNPYYLP